ncbi:hypothetical protein STEG23_026116 [Scotinomys teguina]
MVPTSAFRPRNGECSLRKTTPYLAKAGVLICLQYFQCIQQSEIDQNNSNLHRRNTSSISFNSTQEVDNNSASSDIKHSPFTKKRRDMLAHLHFQCIQQNEVDQNNSTLHQRNISCISFNSTPEGVKNSPSSYIVHSPFTKKRCDMLAHSVESIEGILSIVSLARTKELSIIETQGISLSTPFKKAIEQNLLLRPTHSTRRKTQTCLYHCGANSVQRIFNIVTLARTKESCNRNTRNISFNSIKEGDKNTNFSYIQQTLLAGKT